MLSSPPSSAPPGRPVGSMLRGKQASRAFPAKASSPEMLYLFVFAQSGRKTANALLLDVL
ncbi:hypothetical protein AGR6A_Lc80079 [Agrobacterium sp. NCPPB 925]|nr:hypothetical protein AGR6A_Lc80079 [Agrobacterium sp. NCPPB 925]